MTEISKSSLELSSGSYDMKQIEEITRKVHIIEQEFNSMRVATNNFNANNNHYQLW